MRDEVLAKWLILDACPVLYVSCHVSGGLVFGSAGWRYSIFIRELPLVLEVFRYGDRQFFEANPDLDHAPVQIRFNSHRQRYQRLEQWGTPADYKV